ncbi:hypothetical protein CROQUDRAFT_93132 [Cronartium quercuum f. sp. fusiforme G11]|uniref:RNB domain-containing protein n=1 Tax=Cronartium quercuum f. sp. fusiforme G11 TaxID=708437 RepID=A0A9P6NMA8_9BASI|nr:hypothetical protein CROQUDRAFT_93132 [Cronartium quercuum f. sp. fusiforme G11]
MAHRHLRVTLFDQHPKPISHRLHSSPAQLSSAPTTPTNRTQWQSFEPIAQQLISIHRAFYNRSHHLPSAQRWEALRAQGYKPAKRSPLEVKWWEEERRRGRVQPDHQISRPLLSPRPSRKLKSPPDRKSFTSTTSSSQLNTFGLSRSPSMIRKDSPDVIDLVGGAVDFGSPDLDYGGLDFDSSDSPTWTASVGQSPGARGFSGLQAGSFIELRRTNQSETGIVVSVIGSEVIYVSRSGEIRLNSLDNVMYIMHHVVESSAARKAVDPEVSLERLADPTLMASSSTKSAIDRNLFDQKATAIADARKHCCRTLRVIDAKLDRCHAILTKAGSYNLYNHFKHAEPGKTAQLSTEEGVRFLLGHQHISDEIMLFALHQQLMANSDMFIANAREMRDQSAFSLQSEETLEALYTVREWVARDSMELKLFVDKARRVIESNQSLQKSSGASLPLRLAPVSFASWTPSDLLFIKVFRTIAITQRMIQDQPLNTVVAAVLKKIELYDERAMLKTWPVLTFDRFGAIVLLRDIGVLPAWQSVGLWDPSLDLKSRYRAYLTNKANPAHSKPLRTIPITSSPAHHHPKKRSATKRDSPILDPADVLRHDFGDMPVYIIDDPNAEELDDGVSIELVEDSAHSGPQLAWIHVHIADPTTCLHPSHPIALEARRYLETLYLPGFTLPMLPPGFIQANKLSLGVDGEGGGQRTLTFSALLDQTGNILDHKIRPGFINCTKQVIYDLVTTILDGQASPPAPTLTIGQPSASKPTENRPTLTLDQLDDDDRTRLKQLATFAAALTRRRVNDGALGWNLPTPSVSVHDSPGLIHPRFSIPASPKLLVGTPAVTIRLPGPIVDHRTHRWGLSSAQQLVSEFMILAGRLAGRVLEPDLLLPFRTQPPPELNDVTGNAEALAMVRKQLSPDTGLVSPFVFQRARIKFLPASHALQPHPHAPLGVEDRFGYCKVTSPLRRYSDLVAHWQLKSALLRASGRVGYPDPQAILSQARMQELVGRLDRETKAVQIAGRKLQRSWMSYVLSRAPAALKKLRGVVCSEPVLVRFTNMWSMKVYIPELGLKASLVAREREDWFAGGTRVGAEPATEDIVGLCVPVKVVYVNEDDHFVVELERERIGEMKMMV